MDCDAWIAGENEKIAFFADCIAFGHIISTREVTIR